MADVFIEKTSMYSCDYDDLTLIGSKSLFEDAPSVEELQQVDTIIRDCMIFLQLQSGQSNPLPHVQADKMKFIMDMWVYRFDVCCTEVQGDAVSDALFVARCFLLCCEYPACREMSHFNDISELYARLQLAGTNHTRRRFDQPQSHMEMVSLEKRAASLVVYHLSVSPDELLERCADEPLPAIDELLVAEIMPLRRVPDIVKPTEEELKAEADRLAAEARRARKENAVEYDELQQENSAAAATVVGGEIEYDVNEGSYWHSDKHTVLRGFVASRIMRNYWLHKQVFDKYPVRAPEDVPVYPPSTMENFTAWFEHSCESDAGDDNIKTFRDLVFEHWLPVGSRQVMLRTFSTRHEILAPLNLLENQLGVDSATSLANMARVKTKVIVKQSDNEVYEFLLMSQFCYLMKHLTNTDFKKIYYIMPGELGKHYKRLDCKVTWGQARRPILLRILRAWWLHDDGEWVPCSSLADALLKMMTLWKMKYNSQFVDRTNLEHWITQVTSQRNDE